MSFNGLYLIVQITQITIKFVSFHIIIIINPFIQTRNPVATETAVKLTIELSDK